MKSLTVAALVGAVQAIQKLDNLMGPYESIHGYGFNPA